MKTQVSIAIIGAGDVSVLYYLPALKNSSLIHVAAICDLNLDRANLVAKAFDIPKIFQDYKEMLIDTSIDAVLNLTPPFLHFEINRAVIAAGKNLYSEKPMASTLEEADILIKEAAVNQIKFAVAPSVMIDPVNVAVKKLLSDHVIGKISYAVAHFSHGGPASRGYFDFYTTLVNSYHLDDLVGESTDPSWFYQGGSGGALADLGIYSLTTLTGLLGPARRITSFATRCFPEVTIMGGVARGKRIEVNEKDCTLVLLDFGNGVLATVDSAWTVQASKGPMIEIYGSEGTISINKSGEEPAFQVFLEKSDELRGWITPTFVNKPKWNVGSGMHNFAEAVLYNQKPVMSGEHARHVFEIITHSQVANEEGRTIELHTKF